MISRGEQVRVSKRLSYVLRHRPDSVGLELGEGGWVTVDALLHALASGGVVSRDVLETVVRENDKQRFEMSADGLQIRARQGHSVAVDLGYEPATPPESLLHGTAERFLDSIFAKGLVKGKRHHVHMGTDRALMVSVGGRHGKPVVLEVAAGRMHADGHAFFVTGNGVWLTEHVPAKYLTLDASSRSQAAAR